MFSQPIVFIVGAGASSEFGLPTGAEMNVHIAKALGFAGGAVGQGNRSMFDMIAQRYRMESPKYHEAAAELASRIGQFVSVDEALHWHSHRPEIITLGKAEIVRQILSAEARSKLFNSQNPSLIREASNDAEWLQPFFSMAIASLKKQTVGEIFRNVTIINFNYDRTIEHFLYSRFQTNLGLTEAETKQAISSLMMLRPYGQVSHLPWQEGRDWRDAKSVKFGEEISSEQERLFSLSENIRTYTEQNLTADFGEQVRRAINDSRIVVFLGFGFNQQNMNLIKIDRTAHWRRVFATGIGIDGQNYDDMKLYIAQTVGSLPDKILLLPRSAHGLLNTMKPSIMAAL